jgi:SPP1 family predicted phage head-tail adaptor
VSAAGALRHAVEVQQDLGELVDGNDALGQPRERWRTLFHTRAEISPWTGREYWQAAQAQAETTLRFRCRYRPEWRDVTAGCRVLWQGRAYHLTEPPRVRQERGEWVEVMAKVQP